MPGVQGNGPWMPPAISAGAFAPSQPGRVYLRMRTNTLTAAMVVLATGLAACVADDGRAGLWRTETPA